MRAASASEPPALSASSARTARSTEPAPRVEIEQALRELGHLADAAGNGDARDGMAPHIFEHAADEVAHVDQRGLGQAVQLLHRRFGGGARRAGDMGEASGAGDIDAAMDRVDPGRAGIGHDDSRRAEDREAADNAEASVERLGGKRLSTRNGDLDLDIAVVAMRRSDFGDRRAHHLPRHGIDGGLARRKRKAGPRNRADAFARAEGDTAPRRATPHRGEDEGAMRHVRVVAGVLHHTRRRAAIRLRP